jgi:hypothetical protein
MCATSIIDGAVLEKLPRLKERFESIASRKAEYLENIACPKAPGVKGRRLLAVLDESKLRRVFSRMLDENEFLGPFGIRSLSRYHQANPYSFIWNDQEHRVSYSPGESDSHMFGGNSNWRGPVWIPTNFLILRALWNLYTYYGDEFEVECPTGSGNQMNLFQVGEEITRRLAGIFLRNDSGNRPVFGGSTKFQSDPHWRDHILFYEYFHADDGAGIGASHQTGWTGMIATMLVLLATLEAEDLLEHGLEAASEAIADAPEADGGS